MKNINGQGNEITIILPHKKIDCISSHHEEFNQNYRETCRRVNADAEKFI